MARLLLIVWHQQQQSNWIGDLIMAKISAHGEIIGTVYFTTKAKRYMSDNTILVNYGQGWKLGPKLRAGVDAQTAYQNQMARQVTFLAENPHIAAYRKALHSLAGMSTRWKLDMAISMMPDDSDGVWSECCDGYGDNVHADLDEVSYLCALYRSIPARQAQTTE